MITNRSAPAPSIMPVLVYRNVADAIDWLSKAFGLQEYYRHTERDGFVSNAQMRHGDAWILLGGSRKEYQARHPERRAAQSVMIFVEDAEAHYRRAKAAGVTILVELVDTRFGERQYKAEDPEGHQWWFSQHLADVAPDAWGATVATAAATTAATTTAAGAKP